MRSFSKSRLEDVCLVEIWYQKFESLVKETKEEINGFKAVELANEWILSLSEEEVENIRVLHENQKLFKWMNKK